MQIIIGQPYLNVLHGNRIIALSLIIEHKTSGYRLTIDSYTSRDAPLMVHLTIEWNTVNSLNKWLLLDCGYSNIYMEALLIVHFPIQSRQDLYKLSHSSEIASRVI